MFSYKILPLALLISIPLVAMDQQLTSAVTPADALNATLLVCQQVTESEDEVAQLKQAQASLDARITAALARKNAKIDELTKKYTAKCDEVCSLDALKLEDTKKVKQAENDKTSALETLFKDWTKTKEALELQLHTEETKYNKVKTTKEQEHDLIINAATAVVAQRQSNIERISQTRDQLHAQLTKAKAASVEQKSGLFGFGILGL